MTQKDPYNYGVQKDEKVTFELTPLNGAVGERVTAAIDGTGISNSGSNEKPIFNFTVTKNTGESHFVMLAFSFVDGDPNDARYKVRIKSSKEGDYMSKTVRKIVGTEERNYEFSV